MRKLTRALVALAALAPYSITAQAFTFSATAALPEEMDQQLIAEISKVDSTVLLDNDAHFRDLSALCSGDILVFGDGKTLCGELVDMPPLMHEETKTSLGIPEISAIIFDSAKDPPLVHYVLSDGRSIVNTLAKDSFRFSVEYLEKGGEQRVQIFYISPKDIHHIIISPRLPTSQPGINSSKLNIPKGVSGGALKSMSIPDNRLIEAVQLAASWFHPDSHSLLSDAYAAVFLPLNAITALHDGAFSNIVSYYAELGAVDDDNIDFKQLVFDDSSEALKNRQTHGLIFGPRALFSALETFDPYHELALEDGQNSFNEINMLATAAAAPIGDDFALDSLKAYNMFATDFNVHFNDDEDFEENDGQGLSGIKYMANNQAPTSSQDSLPGIHGHVLEHLAFVTDSCKWFEHKYQCTEDCEAAEWPPVKRGNSYAAADHFHSHDLNQMVLSDVIDKIKENEMIAIESQLLDPHPDGKAHHSIDVSEATPNNQPRVHFGSIDIASYPVSNQDYYRFVQAAKHQPPPHWVNGAYALGQAHLPVVNVTYMDAVAYAEWAKERLPTHDELARASGSLALVAKQFKEWTSTPSVVDSEYVRVYRQKGEALLLQPGKYGAADIGFRCVKDVR